MSEIGNFPDNPIGSGFDINEIGSGKDFTITPSSQGDKGIDTGSTVENSSGTGGNEGVSDPSNPEIGSPDNTQGSGGVYSGNKWLTGIDSALTIFNLILDLGPEMREIMQSEIENKLKMMVAKAENARETAEIQMQASEFQAQMYEADKTRAIAQIVGAVSSLVISIGSAIVMTGKRHDASSKFKKQQNAHNEWSESTRNASTPGLSGYNKDSPDYNPKFDPSAGGKALKPNQPEAPSEELYRSKMETFTMVSQTITQTSQSISQIISSIGEIMTADEKASLERIKGELDALKTMMDSLGQTLSSTTQASSQDLQEMMQHADRLSKILEDAIRTSQGVWNPGRQY